MRDLLNNKPLMLGLILLLATIKFGVVPLLEWQEAKVVSIGKLEERLLKTERLLLNKDETLSTINTISQEISAYDELIFKPSSDEVQFKLGQQEIIEELFTKNGLSVSRTSWLTSVQKVGYEELMMEMTVTGSFKQLMRALLVSETMKPKIALANFTLNVSRMRASSKRLGRVSGKITFTVWRKYKEE